MGLTRIICQVTGEPSSLSFVWSDGTEDFRPYQLTELALASFRQNALKARQSLRGLVEVYQDDDSGRQWQCLYEIAESGWKLYRGILQRTEESSLVEAWLKDCQERNDIASLEIVTSGEVSVPWNTIYGVEPVRDAFASHDEAALIHFWGRAYNLASGRRVDPLRRRPRLDDPQVLFVGDLSTINELEEAGRTSLQNFVEERHFSAAHSKAELESCLRRQSYQLIYWFSHATSDHLYLGDAKLSAQDLFDLLDSLAKKPSGGIAFLNACLTAQVTSGEGAFLSALIGCGLSGIIGTEHVIPDYYANQFGLELLENFLNGSGPIAELMRDLRSKHPLGLLYATCCPPYITITPAALKAGTPPNRLEPDLAHAQRPDRPGALLGVAPVIAEEEERALPSLPDSPYVALAAYDRTHRALFAGRRADCDRFALILNAPSTRLLILQGATGVGKTSFLRAEVIPFLEEESIGYRFLRRRAEKGTGLSGGSEENDSGIIFVRAGKDLVAELAQAIWDFSVVPYQLRRPNGEQATIDLREIVARAGSTAASAADLVGNLRRDDGLLHQILLALSAALPFAILLIVDQAEEVFTQGQGEAALTALGRIAAAAEGDYKIIISLRTEYYGRLVNALRKGSRGANTIREYLLTDFSEDDLVEAITRPTVSGPIPYASEIPAEKYGFSFEPGLAREIAREVRAYAANSQDSVLPLIQVICTQLFERITRPGIVTAGDLKTIGGVSGGMLRHVETLIETLFTHPADRAGVKHLLTKLYVQHPDGTLTTALLPEEDLKSHWRGEMQFAEMLAVASDPKYRLLKRGRLRVGDSSQRSYVSLGHDTLANVARVWKKAEQESARTKKEIAGALAALTLIALFGFLWWQTNNAKNKVEEQRSATNAERLAAKAQILYSAQPDLAVLLATGANQALDNLETRSAYMTVLERDPRLLTLLPGHSGGVCHIAFSSDGRILVAQDCTGVVHFWDLATHREVFHRIRMEPKQTMGITLLSGNSMLVVASRNGELRYWNVQSGALAGVCRFAEPPPKPKDFFDSPGRWRRVAFTPDGARMAFTEDSTEVRIWHLPDCSQEKPRKFPAKVREMIFSPDGRLLASGGRDGIVQVLDLASGRIVVSTPAINDGFGGDKIVDAVAFSRDSSQVAASYFSGQVIVLPLKGPLETIKIRQSIADAVGFSADASSVGIGTTWAGRIEVWDRKLKEFVQPLEAHSRGLTAFIAEPYGGTLASAGEEGHVAIWNLNKSCRLCSTIKSSQRIDLATFSPGSHRLAVGTRSATNQSDVAIKIWDGSKLTPLRQGLYASIAVFSSDGKKLAVVSGNKLHLIDAVTGRDLVAPLAISKPAQRPFFPLMSMDGLGARVAFTTMDKEDNMQVEVWDGHSRKVVPRKPAEVLALRLTSDGRLLVIAETSGNVTFWDPANMHEVSPLFTRRIEEHLWKRAAISDDGSMLAEGEDNIIRLWDLKSRASVATSLVGHLSPSYELAFSHDGSTLASGGGDGTIRLWNVATRQTFGPELRSPYKIVGLEFSRDGKRLLSISEEMSLREVGRNVLLWDLDPLHWRTIARRIVNRNLSRQEWQQYVGTVPYRRTFAELP